MDEAAGDEDEEDDEDEVPLVRTRKQALEVAQRTDEERIRSGVVAGPSGQGHLYMFRNLDRETADPRLARFNPR